MKGWRLARSEQARQDLIGIWAYVADDDPAQADKLLFALEALFTKLADFPRLGRPVDDLKDGYRLLSRGPYLLFYTVDDAGREVRLMRVLHGARDVAAELRGG